MSRSEPHRQILSLMTYRAVVVTTLLIFTFIIELLFRPLLPLRPFYLLAGITYLLSLSYGLLYRRLKDSAVFVSIQLIGDLSVVTGLVYATGGPESPFSFLYLILIITASILLFRRGGFLIAS